MYQKFANNDEVQNHLIATGSVPMADATDMTPIVTLVSTWAYLMLPFLLNGKVVTFSAGLPLRHARIFVWTSSFRAPGQQSPKLHNDVDDGELPSHWSSMIVPAPAAQTVSLFAHGNHQGFQTQLLVELHEEEVGLNNNMRKSHAGIQGHCDVD